MFLVRGCHSTHWISPLDSLQLGSGGDFFWLSAVSQRLIPCSLERLLDLSRQPEQAHFILLGTVQGPWKSASAFLTAWSDYLILSEQLRAALEGIGYSRRAFGNLRFICNRSSSATSDSEQTGYLGREAREPGTRIARHSSRADAGLGNRLHLQQHPIADHRPTSILSTSPRLSGQLSGDPLNPGEGSGVGSLGGGGGGRG